MDQTPGAKMMYLIKRKPGTSREELVAHWFANHMPAVIQSQKDGAQRGRPHARRYFATLYDANSAGVHPWDGVAQLWWPQPVAETRRPVSVPNPAIRSSRRRSRTCLGRPANTS